MTGSGAGLAGAPHPPEAEKGTTMLFGADRIEECRDILRGRLALISSPSGRTVSNLSTIDALHRTCDLRLLLAPEHGIRGDIADGVKFDHGVDAVSGLPMMSMYRQGAFGIPEAAYDLFDTLVYDVQDVGCRYYTFISTLKHAMEGCAKTGKRLVVLDRPDPLGRALEGNVPLPEDQSFVGCWSLPVRYGMTCGEFALMVRAEERLDLDLEVICCSGLGADMDFPAWDRPWIMTSPAMPRFETVALYPGTCLFEGTNCSEGRGTSDPFAIIGAPYVDAEAFSLRLNALSGELPGFLATPLWFTPTFSKHTGTLCGGVHIHLTDHKVLRSYELGIRMLDLLREMYPADFRINAPYEGMDRPFISWLAGSRGFEDPDWNAEQMLLQAHRDCEAFVQRRDAYLLYR